MGVNCLMGECSIISRVVNLLARVYIRVRHLPTLGQYVHSRLIRGNHVLLLSLSPDRSGPLG